MDFEQLRRIGWNGFSQQQLGEADFASARAARVSAHHGSHIMLLGEDGEFSTPTQQCRTLGELAVGDWLLVDAVSGRPVKRLTRSTLLERKAAGTAVRAQLVAANVDTIFIVTSCNEELSLARIERYLAVAMQAGAAAVVLLTKADLCDTVAPLRRDVEQLSADLVVESLDARDPQQTSVLQTWIGPGRTIALLGSSGVGKSTLAMTLGAGELATGAIREQDAKGRHTTTARSLHLLPSGGVLIDNPGMRELQLPECDSGVASVFEEITVLARTCRFRDCRHRGDAGCAVQAAVESGALDERRYRSFLKLEAEQAHNARTLAERRDRERRTGQHYKSVIARKQARREGR